MADRSTATGTKRGRFRGRGRPPKYATSSGAELAAIAGVSETTISHWRREANFPRNAEGETEVYAFIEFILRRDGLMADSSDKEEERLQRLKEAELLEKESKAVSALAKARAAVGELVDRERAIAMVAQLCGYVRSRLQALPAELASELPESAPTDLAEFLKLCGRLRESMTARIENRVETILLGMAQWRPEQISELSIELSDDSEMNSNSSTTSGNNAANSPREGSPGRSRGRPRKSPISTAAPTITTTTPT